MLLLIRAFIAVLLFRAIRVSYDILAKKLKGCGFLRFKVRQLTYCLIDIWES